MQSNYGAGGSTPVVEETSPQDVAGQAPVLPAGESSPVAEQVKAGGIQGDIFPDKSLQGVTLETNATVPRTDLRPPGNLKI
jgi:hypothetical protein